METLKAGCVLVNTQTNCIGLIYREHLKDYTFPKGHLEEGEDLLTCAIRETAEETKRIAVVDIDEDPYIEKYITPKGEHCICYLYLAIDGGKSDNDSTDTHDLMWVPIDKVENILSYQSIKYAWQVFKPRIKKLLSII